MPYTYSPIPHNAFRILDLLPSNGSTELRGTLHTMLTGSISQYEALSYCWGDSKTTETMYIDSQELQITQSLASAMRHLRYEGDKRLLWIDQICIDQRSIPERNHQVQNLMGEIYTKATGLVIWLGEADETSSLAIPAVRKACQEIKQNGGDCSYFRADLALANMRDVNGKLDLKPFVAIRRLRTRSWFSRAWVVQELCLPLTDRITIHCGKETLNWAEFNIIDNAIGRYSWHNHIREAPSEVRLILEVGQTQQPLELSRQLFQSSREHNKPKLSSLLSNLWLFRHRSCTIAKDKVYSFKHLGQDLASENLRIDYGISTTEAFTDVARTIIQNTKRLSVLGACHIERNFADLPSWVPDWTMKSARQPLRQLTSIVTWDDPGWHRSLPEMDAIIIPTRLTSELALHGYPLHTISIVSSDRTDPWKSLIECDLAALMVDLMTDVRSMVSIQQNGAQNKATPSSGAVKISVEDKRKICITLINMSLSLWPQEMAKGQASHTEAAQSDTLSNPKDMEKRQMLDSLIDQAWSEVCRSRPDRNINSNTLAQAAFALLFPETEWRSEDHSAIWTTLVVGQDNSQMPLIIDDPCTNLPAFLFGIVPSIYGRKFFTTVDRADVGMCPYEVQPGDVICLFPGSNVPVVLRAVPNSDHWSLIGHCYYYKYMDGTEGAALLDASVATRVFTLV